MHTVNILEGQSHFTQLAEQAAGETIVILEAGKPRAMLTPFASGAFSVPCRTCPAREGSPVMLPRWPGKVIVSLRRERMESYESRKMEQQHSHTEFQPHDSGYYSN